MCWGEAWVLKVCPFLTRLLVNGVEDSLLRVNPFGNRLLHGNIRRKRGNDALKE